MGLGAGLASSTLTAYIVDAAPARPTWLASVASSQTVMLGLAVGAIASGALVQFGPWPRGLIYLVVIGLLLLSAALVAISPETVTPTPGGWRSLHPGVRVPIRVRHLLPVAAAVFLATWATGAFYQAFVPALVEDQLHTNSSLVLGLVFAAYMGPSALGAPLGGRFSPAAAQRIGMIAFLAGWIGLITAITTGALPLFIAATIIAGAAQGIAISAATRGLLFGSTLPDRAPTFAVVYLLSYSGATIPSIISARLSTSSPYRRSPSDTPGLRWSPRWSLPSLHATRTPRPRAANIVSNLLDADEREGPKAAASCQRRLGGGANGAASSSVITAISPSCRSRDSTRHPPEATIRQRKEASSVHFRTQLSHTRPVLRSPIGLHMTAKIDLDRALLVMSWHRRRIDSLAKVAPRCD